MKILLAQEQDERRWQEFLENQPRSSNYHRWGWRRVIERAFGWQTYYMMAEENGRVAGILPIVWQNSRLFGSFLTSVPFLNAGGIVAENAGAQNALVAEAVELAQRLKVKYLELRHRWDGQFDLTTKTNKITIVRQVTPDADALLASFKAKLRSDLKKAQGYGLTVEFGGAPFLDEFYSVFADNMRNLGTPVYSRKFFAEILREFPNDSYLCIVRHEGRAISGSFLTGFRDSVEAMWSASLYSHSKLKPNMFMYWKILEFAGAKGYQTFDFGRSTVGSGTHSFKMQWGSKEVPLYWVYWMPGEQSLPELNPNNPRYRAAIWTWQHLPLFVTNLIGPSIVRCLP